MAAAPDDLEAFTNRFPGAVERVRALMAAGIDMHKAIDLARRERDDLAFRLRHVEGLTYRAIGEQLGVGKERAHQLVARAWKRYQRIEREWVQMREGDLE